MAVEYAGVDTRVKCGDSALRLNESTLCRSHPFYALLCSIQLRFTADRMELNDVILGRFLWPIVPDKDGKFGDPGTNRSR